MSLLMDALKRAELAKQQGQESDAPASGLSLEPTTPPETLPELPAKLEDLDHEFLEQARPAAPAKAATAEPTRQLGAAARRGSKQSSRNAAPAADTTAEREAVRNAFAAKSGIGNERKVALAAVGLGLLALGLIGAWLWLEFKPVQGLVATRAPAGPEMGAQQGSIAAAAPISQGQPAASTPVASLPAAQSATQRDVDDEQAESRAIVRQPAPRRPVAALPVAAEPSIRVSATRPGVDPGVAEGYRLLQAGNLSAAKAAYAEVLKGDPRNADALHGVAAIALRQGRADDAEAAYLRILEANPADPTAQAAMVGLSSQGDPVAGESRMKSLLAAQGDLAVVNFALGNLYARQQRWNDAQQAYFKAVTADANNPDYLFNLAVSLDQLRQPKLAAQYYGQALSAAEGRAAAFDRSLAARRIRELQP